MAIKALREGPLKLVADEKGPWRLYDLSTDKAEMHDLADAQPEIVGPARKGLESLGRADPRHGSSSRSEGDRFCHASESCA